MEYAGLKIPVDLSIALLISGQIANGNAGPTSALRPMGGKSFFCCHMLNIASIYKQ